MIPQRLLDVASAHALTLGLRMLQGHRFANTDSGHVKVLLDYMQPKPDTLWLDVGSGFGEVARLMCEARPDLSFFLLNNNAFQLAHSPADFRCINADMHAIPLGDATVDGCMLLYSLCHADNFSTVLREAARVTCRGGALFVYDYDRTGGDDTLFQTRLLARALAFPQIRDLAIAAGWAPVLHVNPAGEDAWFRLLYGNDAEYDLIFADLVPSVWRMERV